MNKLIVILGPTASGKSDLAVQLSLFLKKKLKKEVEIISADSRQVYQKMNIGTGKITKKEMRGIPHHLLDIVSPKTKFSVAQYQKKAHKKIDEIFKKNRLPIVVGGTGFYIQSITDGLIIPQVKPNWQLRKKLEKKSVNELYKILKKIDQERAKKIDNKNPRRLIRAIEIVTTSKKPVPKSKITPPPYQILIIGLEKSKSELKKLIRKRLIQRLNKGMVREVKKLKKNGLSWKRLEDLGLEYRWLALYLQKKISYQEMVGSLERAIIQFSKRQITWFKRDHRIHWIKNYQEVKMKINTFLK